MPFFKGICFVEDSSSIHGSYPDILSAYRAKKAWVETLRFNFGLSEGTDINLDVTKTGFKTFVLNLGFVSSNAKYAFWKITNNQEPEVQYTLETAHIPMCEKRYEEILTAPDLCSIFEIPAIKSALPEGQQKSKLNTIINKVLS